MWTKKSIIQKLKHTCLLVEKGCRAITNHKTMNEWTEQADMERRRLNKIFPGPATRAANEHLDKVSIVKKYQQIYLRSRFPFGVPDNFLTGEKVVAILQAGKK